MPILPVACVGHVPEIGDPVVSPVAVDVVNLMSGPIAVEVQPGEPLRKVLAVIYRYSYIPVALAWRGGRAYRRPASCAFESGKNARVWVIQEDGFETFLRQRRIDGAHVACSLKTMMWEVTRRACKPWALRHFTPGGAYGT